MLRGMSKWKSKIYQGSICTAPKRILRKDEKTIIPTKGVGGGLRGKGFIKSEKGNVAGPTPIKPP